MCQPHASKVNVGLVLGGLALLSILFWADCLLGPYAPLDAGHQAHMEPWRSEADLPGTMRRWDALLWDGVAQFYPWRLFAARELRRGELALWNPHQFCGYPFLANGQSALFYPPNWLLALVDVKWGLAALAALHYFLAAALTYLFCRQLQMRHLPAAFAGIAYAYGGFMVTWTELPTLMNAATWLPGALLGVSLVFAGSGWGVPVLGVSLAMSVLAGHFQVAAYVWLVAGFYALARLTWEDVNRRPMRAAPLLGGFALGAALCCAQVLPTLELGANSPRGAGAVSEVGFEFHLQRALRADELIALLFPDAYGDAVHGYSVPGRIELSYTEHCGFLGISTLVLVVAGILLSRTRHLAFFVVLAAAALNVAMGGPLARLLYFGVPKLGLAGGFHRLLCAYTFAVAVAGGLGLNALCRRLAPRDRSLEEDEGACPWNLSAGRGLCLIALLVLVYELLPWAHGFLPRCRREHVYPVTPTIERLMQADGRVLAITPRTEWRLDRAPRAVLPPNSATVYQYDSVAGYDSLFPRSYREFAFWAEGGDPAPLANGNMLLPERADDVLWRVTGVRQAFAQGRVRALERTPYRGPFPRAFVALGFEPWLGDGPSIREWFEDYWVHIREHPPAVIGITVDGQYGRPAMGRIQVTLRDRAGTKIGGERLLVATETFYPGWRAYVDGQQRQIETVAGTFCGVRVDDGDREVRLVFVPESVQVGIFVTLVGLGALCATLVGTARRRRAVS
jgi:hypothetical protein